MSLPNLIEIATDEKQTEDDWTKILDVCEKGASNPKECLKLILRRMFNRNPHVVLRSIILLDACVQNIGESFAKEISSRYFVTEIKSKSKNMHHKALERLCFMLKKWNRELSGNQFDPFSFITELNKWLQDTYPTLYAAGDDELNSRNTAKQTRKVVVGQEEADIAKAIELSLKETESKRQTLYPTTFNSVTNDTAPKKSTTKVRALYDFEAAEENELTFKAGEIIIDVDTSNEHWWTGSNHRGEGMFPAQFVTVDLEAPVERPTDQRPGGQGSQDPTSQQVRPPTPAIDEARIDECLRLLEDTDPTGEVRADPPQLTLCEAQCRQMGPLIDQELERVDRRYNRLVEINRTIIDSFQMYNELMVAQGGPVGVRPGPGYAWGPPLQYAGTGHLPPMQAPAQGYEPAPARFPPMGYYLPDPSRNPQMQPGMIQSHPQQQVGMAPSLPQLPQQYQQMAPGEAERRLQQQHYLLLHQQMQMQQPPPPPPSTNNSALLADGPMMPGQEAAPLPNMGMLTYSMHNGQGYPSFSGPSEPGIHYMQK